MTEAALDSEPTPENLALAERFLRRANAFESRSFFELVPDSQFPTESRVALDDQKIRVTPGIVEANERLARIFASGAFGVKDEAKANEFRRFAQEFAADYATATQTTFFDEPTVDARRSFVAPQTPEFEATIAQIFAKLEKTLVDAKNGNAAALTARFDEYFDDATDLYPNGRSGSPEVARYKVERLTREIERLEQTDADAETLERLRQTRDSWRRLAAETPVVATSA